MRRRMECCCEWTLDAGHFNLSLVIPPNTTAKVVMPDKQASLTLGEKQEGIVIGSGQYEFSCAFEPEKWKPISIPLPFYVPIKEEPW